jgi:hypothetical protein
MGDLEMIPNAASAALRRDSGELVFTLGRAVEVVQACTASGIAVLGVEVFPGLNVSTYDLHVRDPTDEKDWPSYVRTNNALAEDFLKRNPASSTDECILTSASWREFCEIREQARVMRERKPR